MRYGLIAAALLAAGCAESGFHSMSDLDRMSVVEVDAQCARGDPDACALSKRRAEHGASLRNPNPLPLAAPASSESQPDNNQLFPEQPIDLSLPPVDPALVLECERHEGPTCESIVAVLAKQCRGGRAIACDGLRDLAELGRSPAEYEWGVISWEEAWTWEKQDRAHTFVARSATAGRADAKEWIGMHPQLAPPPREDEPTDEPAHLSDEYLCRGGNRISCEKLGWLHNVPKPKIEGAFGLLLGGSLAGHVTLRGERDQQGDTFVVQPEKRFPGLHSYVVQTTPIGGLIWSISAFGDMASVDCAAQRETLRELLSDKYLSPVLQFQDGFKLEGSDDRSITVFCTWSSLLVKYEDGALKGQSRAEIRELLKPAAKDNL